MTMHIGPNGLPVIPLAQQAHEAISAASKAVSEQDVECATVYVAAARNRADAVRKEAEVIERSVRAIEDELIRRRNQG